MTDIHRDTSRFPSRTQALVIFVISVVLIALAGAVLVFVIPGWSNGVIHDTYYYHLFVRIQTPGPRAEIWVPVPDFPELRDRVSIDEDWTRFTFPEFPSRNVSQSIASSAYGTMYRFVFSESFALYGFTDSAPGSANGTLTFSSQMSNRTWIYLTNVSSENRVSIILFYEQIGGFGCGRVSFLGTADPRVETRSGGTERAGYVGRMVYNETSYTSISAGWGLYRLVDGAFTYCGSGD
jgi:hypothetical protein